MIDQLLIFTPPTFEPIVIDSSSAKLIGICTSLCTALCTQYTVSSVLQHAASFSTGETPALEEMQFAATASQYGDTLQLSFKINELIHPDHVKTFPCLDTIVRHPPNCKSNTLVTGMFTMCANFHSLWPQRFQQVDLLSWFLFSCG